MKKQMISIGIAAVLMIGTAGAFAGGAVQKIGELIQEQVADPPANIVGDIPDVLEENQPRREAIEQRLSQQENAETMSLYDRMIQALEATAENPIDFNNVIYNYEYLHKACHLTDTEMEYIAGLIVQGYDPMTVMDICYFWLDTNEEIDIISQIYMLKSRHRNHAWIENAFNEITNNKCGVLNESDVDNYLRQGVTLSDIAIANKLCRRGVLTIQEILAEHQQGKTFAELAAAVNGIPAQELPAQALEPAQAMLAEETAEAPDEAISTQEIMFAEELSKIENKPLSSYYQKVLDGESLQEMLSEKSDALEAEIISKLRSEGLYKTASEEAQKEYLSKERERNA